MPPRSKIDQLPDAVREELEAMIIKRRFSGYIALADWLKGKGYQIGKSAVGEYGLNLQSKLAGIKASTEAARQIAESAPDDADQRSAAVLSLIQTQVFDVMMGLQDASASDDPIDRAKLLSRVAKDFSTAVRASIYQKKHAIELRGKAEAAANKAATIAKKGGLSAAAVKTIRSEILGIAA